MNHAASFSLLLLVCVVVIRRWQFHEDAALAHNLQEQEGNESFNNMMHTYPYLVCALLTGENNSRCIEIGFNYTMLIVRIKIFETIVFCTDDLSTAYAPSALQQKFSQVLNSIVIDTDLYNVYMSRSCD